MGVFYRQFCQFLPWRLLFGSSPEKDVVGSAICSLQPLAIRSALPPEHFECFVGLRRINSYAPSICQAIEILGHFTVTVRRYLTVGIRAPVGPGIICFPDMQKAQAL